MLRLENICKTYNIGSVNESTIFKDFNLTVDTGEFVSVIGSNGSGKTSILNVICGYIPIDSGNVILDGKNLNTMKEFARSRFIGRVFQDPQKGTCPTMNIIENMSLADNKGKLFGLSKCVNKNRIDYYKTMVEQLKLGLEDKMYVPVGLLSGGQRQALALLISTMTPIDLLILDEHTAALDPKTSETIMELTDKIVREKGITTLMVTHNLKFAVNYGNRLLMMHQGQVILDKKNEDKQNTQISQILEIFNEISIECGN